MVTGSMSHSSRCSLGAASLLIAVAAGCTFEVPDPVNTDPTGGQQAGGGGQTVAPGGGPAGGDGTGGEGGSCVPPETTCPGESGCFDIFNDVEHCGASCTDCGTDAECDNGVCICPVGTQACNNPPGCYQTGIDPDHCGGCEPCAPGQSCLNSVCDCDIGTQPCPGFTGCFNLQTDEDHCGQCTSDTSTCEDYETCIAGVCGCDPGEVFCTTPVPGCFADTLTNSDHCGASCAVCDPTEICSGGTCQCPSGTHACSLGGPECFPDDDDTHCGADCEVCTGDLSCVGGVCGCPVGTTQCGDECVADLTNNPLHCGACNRACSTPRFIGGVCTASSCSPGEAVNTATYVGTVATDKADPTRLYFAGNSGFGALYRVNLTNATPAELGPNIDFINVTMAAHAGNVAVTLQGTDSPLQIGPFPGPLTQVDANVPGGATFIAYSQTQNELYWSENAATGCVFRQGDLAGFACGQRAESVAFFNNTAYLATPGTSAYVDKFTLPSGARSSVDVAGPTGFPASASPGIAVSSDESVFYFSTSPLPVRVRRYPKNGTFFDDVDFYSIPGSAQPLALFADGSEVYWMTKSGTTVSIQHAPANANPAGLVPTTSTFQVPAGADLRSWVSDATAFYFVRQQFSPSLESKLFRVAK